MGCRTGTIGINLARDTATSATGKVRVVALDVSPAAVALSKENAFSILSRDNNDDAYKVYLCSAADFTNNNDFWFGFNLVVSNPPYIPAANMATLAPNVADYKSADALYSGTDGLDVVWDIV